MTRLNLAKLPQIFVSENHGVYRSQDCGVTKEKERSKKDEDNNKIENVEGVEGTSWRICSKTVANDSLQGACDDVGLTEQVRFDGEQKVLLHCCEHPRFQHHERERASSFVHRDCNETK